MDLWTSALAAWEADRAEHAVALLEDLLSRAPADATARHLYAVASTRLGAFDQAIRHLRIVCDVEPDNLEARFDLVNAQRLAGRLVDAEATLRREIAHKPGIPDLYYNLGIILSAAARPAEAEDAFSRAVELDPDDQAAWLQLGMHRYARSDHPNAATAFLRAAELDGDDRSQAVRLAGFALADAGRPDQAEPLLASLCPESPEQTEDFHLLSQLLFCRMELCDWRQLSAMIARCKQFLAQGLMPLEPFTFQLLPGITAGEQLALTARFAEHLMPQAPLPAPVIADPDPERRLRIGYLSADFHDHAVMRLLIGVLEHHDHAGFEIHAFSYGGDDPGQMRGRILAACDRFHDVTPLTPDRLAARIREHSIDILVDLTGWTGNTRSATLGYRPAPIQVNWLGYSGTLGSRILADYLIGDAVVTPAADQANFAEELVLMPGCCHPGDSSRPIGRRGTRGEQGLPEHGMVFCCFSRQLKITPQIFDCWCDLLLAVPGSVLWLYAANDRARSNLVAEAGRRGLAESRLVFAAALPPEQHLARLALADLALDTFPFGAHTTTSDALWAGLPVLTLMGDTLASRVSASMLQAVGLGELATTSIAAYRATALEYAADNDYRDALRARLNGNRLTHPLFDTRAYTGALETRFRNMWQRHCENSGSAR